MSMTCELSLEHPFDIRRHVMGTQMMAVHMPSALTPPKKLRNTPTFAKALRPTFMTDIVFIN
jgi:hypothetical protein